MQQRTSRVFETEGILKLPEGFMSNPLWYKDAILYELSVRSFSDSNADGVGDFAADVGVDFVKDEQGNPVVARQYCFDGQHDA